MPKKGQRGLIYKRRAKQGNTINTEIDYEEINKRNNEPNIKVKHFGKNTIKRSNQRGSSQYSKNRTSY